MRICITQEDIDLGGRGSLHCPVSLGFLKALGPNSNPCVGFSVAYAGDKDMYRLPQEVTARIGHYDKTGEMEPFEFDIEVEPTVNAKV